MPFWGASDARKEAEGFPREYGAWSSDRMRRMLALADQYGGVGPGIDEETLNHWRQRLAGGLESPEEIRGRGQEISPWIQQFINESRGRQDAIWGMEADRVPAGMTAAQMRERLNNMRGRNEGNRLDLESEIGDTATRQMGREETGFNETVQNLKDSSDLQRSIIDQYYGGARKDNADTYAGLQGFGDTAFTDQRKNLDLIRPGGQAQAARVGRSFAPQVADAMARLRRMGIDPNSPEAQSTLRLIEGQRSRAMDDASAAATSSYVDRANDTSRAELGFRSGVTRDRLGNEINLGTRQGERQAGIADAEGSEYRGLRGRLTGAVNDIDAVRSGRRENIVDTAAEREQALNAQDLDIDRWERGADMEDRDRRADILNAFNSNDLVAGGLQDNQFQQGSQWGQVNRGIQDQAMGNITGVGRDATNNQFRANQAAQGWGGTAIGAYKDAYGYEEPWGQRLLGGALGAVSNYFAPGTGGIVAGAISPTSTNQGGGWGMQGGTQQYGGGQAPGNPAIFSMRQGSSPDYNSFIARMAAMYKQPKPQQQYNPNRTRTLPNGDVQVRF